MKDDRIKIESDENLDDSVIAEENAAETIKKLREKLKVCETEKQEYLTGWQRAKADLVNARKRDEADRIEFSKFANEQLIHEIIPVLEHYETAKSHKDSWEKVDKNWRVGVESIFNQLKKALGEAGLKEIDPAIGSGFDHGEHESVGSIPVDDKKLDHCVMEVAQKGYSLNGKLLRPAKVKVGEFNL
ncbi:nucleotide exchange factor GrpE [Patescibacteria group bacterium]|nr:nucleotide exchange factor GrpE [Patescibacteria group bacterium]MDE1946506.1 nucleotide exchange factor GrpE [Patescibacteria group bacterium]MDE2011249.1 nucleotide exchange factor GrpE [Patescibacteria group bacterium]MDE2233332.1 nucleotide exchange factor GrpE [Patescibacteria group bacterium]